MNCNCAGQGKVIATCPESLFGKVFYPLAIVGFAAGSFAFTKLSINAKITVGAVGTTVLSYAFGLHDKVNNLLFAKHEDESLKPISLSVDFNNKEFFSEDKNQPQVKKGEDVYESLTLFYGTSKADIFHIDCRDYMQPEEGYISEIQKFDPHLDIIKIECEDIESMTLMHKTFEGVDYTFVHLNGDNQNFEIAVQGVINEANIEVY
jgi:hypothetical protein